MSENIRKIAVNLLEEIEERGGHSQELLLKVLPSIEDERDKRLVFEIVYGVLRRNVILLHVIEKFSKKPLHYTPSGLLRIIKVAAYQLLFLKKIPHYAVVNEAVEHAKIIQGHKGGSFVNAILRRISNEGREIFLSMQKDPLRFSFPLWLFYKIRDLFPEDYKELFEYFNKPSPLTFRVNSILFSRDEIISELEKDGIIAFKTPLSKYGIKVKGGRVFHSKAFKQRLIIPQDEGSQLVVQIMDLKPEKTVLELCCGKGVKTSHIAQIMSNKGKIVVCDIDEKKINSLKELLKITNITIVHPIVWNILSDIAPFSGEFDYVLLDAPCTGSGTMGRRPEIRMRINEADIYRLSSLQKQMLYNAGKFVQKDGFLIYASCSIFPEEGIDVVEYFLKRNTNFEYENFSLNNKLSGFILLKPHLNNCDGFFIAKLKRII